MKFYVYYDDGDGFGLLDFENNCPIKIEKGYLKGTLISGAAITDEGELMFFEVDEKHWVTYKDHEEMGLKVKSRRTRLK